MEQSVFLKFNGKIDRRSPQNEGKPENPVLRENLLSRDGKLSTPGGTEEIVTGMPSYPTWMGRYYSVETGIINPKTFVYTQDGRMWLMDDGYKTIIAVQDLFNTNAYPKHALYKILSQMKLYLVDGRDYYEYDGNADNKFEKVTVLDADNNPVNPIDLIEHKDRMCMISETYLFISKNLDPRTFDDADDSIQIIVGSGKGKNLAIKKIEDNLYVLNTEGIFQLVGDTISAVAATFELKLVDERNIIAGGSAHKVEKAIVFLADDFELWQFDGYQSKMLSYSEKLSDFVNRYPAMVKRAVSTYYNHYYMLSFVENGHVLNNLEVWYDTLEDKIDFVRGRNVGCYLEIDPTREIAYQEFGRSDEGSVMLSDSTTTFDTVAINIKLRTRDIVLAQGRNCRITAFRPKIEPTMDRHVPIRYHLDGRSSYPSGVTTAWVQYLRGEITHYGGVNIAEQKQFSDRAKPLIKYARGESVAFEIDDSTTYLRLNLLGIGIDFIVKEKKKGRKVGQ